MVNLIVELLRILYKILSIFLFMVFSKDLIFCCCYGYVLLIFWIECEYGNKIIVVMLVC